jgi:hypothetical protein
MGCCNSYPPCQANDANVCDPLTTTDEAYKIVVEDIAFCKKTVAPPTNVSALQYDSTSLVNWKDGSTSKPFSLPQLQGATGATGYAGVVGVKSNGDFIKFVAATGATGATGYDVIANNGSGWNVVSGAVITGVSDQPKGGGSNRVFFENDIIVTDNYTITTNKNALTAGPITVNSGVIVTVPSGSVWTIV